MLLNWILPNGNRLYAIRGQYKRIDNRKGILPKKSKGTECGNVVEDYRP